MLCVFKFYQSLFIYKIMLLMTPLILLISLFILYVYFFFHFKKYCLCFIFISVYSYSNRDEVYERQSMDLMQIFTIPPLMRYIFLCRLILTEQSGVVTDVYQLWRKKKRKIQLLNVYLFFSKIITPNRIHM